MNRLLKILGCIVLSLALALPAKAANFDLVIKSGRVMDPETGYDAIANVGINNGFITKITTDDIKGKRTIDAAGHVVAPGFIDYHTHGQDNFAFRLYARDGVTTPMDLEAGQFPMVAFYLCLGVPVEEMCG